MDSKIYTSKLLDNLQKHLISGSYRFITYPKFVFLCGKSIEDEMYVISNRGVLHRYIDKKANNNVFVVLSEKLWEDAFNSSIDLLTFEDFLAEVSDIIILLAESPGSFCELGAFAYADNLFCDKLIIVIDEKYQNEKSFILTGPTEKAKKDGATVVFAPLSGTGLLASTDLRSVLDKKMKELSSKSYSANKRKPNTIDSQIKLNTFIIELLELLRLLQPISKKDLIEIYKKIKGFASFSFVKRDNTSFHSEIKVDYVYKLLLTVGLISIDTENTVRLCDERKPQSIMFGYSPRSASGVRSKLICRKYRYRGIVK